MFHKLICVTAGAPEPQARMRILLLKQFIINDLQLTNGCVQVGL